MDGYVRFMHLISPSFDEKGRNTTNQSLFCRLQDFNVKKFLFRSVPLFINTSVGNYTLRNGTEQDDIIIL